MSWLLFAGALLAIVVLAIIVNQVTGTKASYLDTLVFETGEKELWRDAGADLGIAPRTGAAMVVTYTRIRRHTVVWTNRRVIVSQKPLFSSRRMITHQIYFTLEMNADDANARTAARETFGGFFGRGFETIIAETKSFDQVNKKDCVRIKPTEECGAMLNINEILIFTDQLAELRQRLLRFSTELQ
jgi:hypothetical protein